VDVSVADLWEFQTRLMEKSTEIHNLFRKNNTAETNGFKTVNGVVPQTMTARVSGDRIAPTINESGSVSILSETDSELTGDYRFVDLPASIVMLLTPKVEVYKVFSEGTDSESPDRAYLLHQGAYTKDSIRRALSEGSITGADDNMQGVVVQGIDFTRLGGNPAEVHTNIKFNIRLYAKSIAEFFTKTDAFPDTLVSDIADFTEEEEFREASNTYNTSLAASRSALENAERGALAGLSDAQEHSLMNLQNEAEATLQDDEAALRTARREYVTETDLKQVAWIDIIKIDPSRELNAEQDPAAPAVASPSVNNQLTVVEQDVRIKATIQYALSGGKPPEIGEEAWTRWKRVVEEQKEEFFLSLLKHEFSFLGMQGVELSVDFVATGNAKALQPSFDLFGGLDIERYRKRVFSGFAITKAERDANLAKLEEFRSDIAIREADLRRLEARREAIEQTIANEGLTDVEAAMRNDLDVGGNRRGIENTERAIRELNENIETCTEKVERSNREEQTISDDVEAVSSKYKMRVLGQLYLEGRPNEPDRLYGAKVTKLNVLNNSHTFFKGNSELDIQALQRLDNLDFAGGDDGVLGIQAEFENSNTEINGKFVFLGDIIEAAYESVVLQNSAQGVDNLAEARQELLDLRAQQIGNDLASEEFMRTRNLITLKIQQIGRLQREIQPPLATLSPEDFQKALNIVDGILTGMVTFPTPNFPTNTTTISIANIPISFDLFRQWFITKASTKKFYPLRDFIPDLMTFTSDMFKKLTYRKSVTETVEMKDYEMPKFIVNNILLNDTDIFKQTVNLKKHVWWQSETIFEKIKRTKKAPNGRSVTVVEQSDVSNIPFENVPNIIFGQADRGILKQITFEREDIPGHAEARLMTDRQSVSSNIALREKYNVSIETRGTTSFLPGSLLYLDITPIELGYTDEANSYAKQLGLGGMYRVVSINSSVSLDGQGNTWTTKIKTKWESFGDGTNGDPQEPGASLSDAEACT